MTPGPQAVGPASVQSRRARGLLEAALKRKPSERVAFIDGACGDDERLRDEVLDLLDASEAPAPVDLGPGIQLPPDRAGNIVAAALQRRRNERLAFLEGACAGDEALRVRALSLLASVDTRETTARTVAGPVLEPAAPAITAPPPANISEEATRIAPPAAAVQAEAPVCQWRPGMSLEGRRVGPYQILHKIGKGGMGSVYAATRADQEYKKLVAIKLVTSELSTEEMLRRFRNERQVLAGLDHPYIGRLLDGGSTEDGLPYLVMEYVDGLPIDRYCESHHLSLTDRLKLFQKVCAAVQYAHQNLVVHRDIKPSNILVGTNGEPKLLDFGIAKLMTAEFSAEEIEISRGEAQPMTLRYASPEQVRGDPITTESDVYSLGVLLYELLAGEHPFQEALSGRAAIQHAILTQEPDKPSAVVRRRASHAPVKREKHSELKLARELSGDIDSIVLTPLAKQPRGRYPSAESFAWDITRFLNGFPVYSRRDDMGYRARKFVRRHALSVASAVLMVIALIVSTIVSLQSLQSARAAHAKAQSRFEDVRKLARFVLFDSDNAIRSSPTEARKLLVTEALAYLNRLAGDARGDRSLEQELVDGYLKVGDVQGNPNGPNLGDTKGARQSYTQALRFAEALRAENPADVRSAGSLARASMKLGDLSEYSGHEEEALKNYRQAQAILEKLPEMDAATKSTLVMVTEKIGTVQLQLGDASAALTSFQRDLQLAQELLAANRNDAQAQRRVALAYDNLGEAMAKSGAVSEGLQKLNTARSMYEQLAAASPQSPARRDVASIDMVIGQTLAGAGKHADAVQSYQHALEITRTLAGEDPKNTEYQRDLHVTLGRLADALYAAGRRQESRAATQQALQVLRPMVDAPGASDYEIYQFCWLLVTTPFRDLQSPALARHYAEQLVQSSSGKDPSRLDLLARAFAAGGDAIHAVETETKAVGLLPAGPSDLRKELEENLANFRARANGKQGQ